MRRVAAFLQRAPPNWERISLARVAKLLHYAVMNERMKDHFLKVTGEKAIRALAIKANIGQSTLNRQLSGTSSVTIETVVAICRSYGLRLAPAFIAAGFITPMEAAEFGIEEALTRATDHQLVTEMMRRVETGNNSSTLTSPVEQSIIDGLA
jgi:DNA-binding phage protein